MSDSLHSQWRVARGLELDLLRQFNDATQRRTLARFVHGTVLLIDPDSAQALTTSRSDLRMISNGGRIVCAVPTRRYQAHAVPPLGAIVRGAWQAPAPLRV